MLVGAGRENSSTEASGRYRERSPGVEDMASTLTDEEEGKTVVDASGEPLGLITTVEEDAAYVEPNPDLAESIAARLGGGRRRGRRIHRPRGRRQRNHRREDPSSRGVIGAK
jgi:hypothetical protein